MEKRLSEKERSRFLRGAIFLMATSAIGPAFLTQTASFTETYLASFAFAILLSLLIDIGVQMNIWRVISVSGKRGQEIANNLLPGLGYVIAGLILFGGFAFNIANIGGAALGLNVLFNLPLSVGGLIAAALTIGLFLVKRFGPIMDRVMQICGVVMLVMVGFVMVRTSPPYQEALIKAFIPDDALALLLPIVTIVGGTVGGYISFAGGHRLIDAGITGKENVHFVGRAASLGIVTTIIMRTFLFLAVLGVVSAGFSLDASNPAATAFLVVLGDAGYYMFGLVLFVAAISSVIGCAYTSISFLRSFHPLFSKYNSVFIAGFIAISASIFLTIGQPVTLLIVAGALNGLILPIVLTTILIASRKKEIVGDYHHPTPLLVFGMVTVLVTGAAGYIALEGIATLWTSS
ncbi:MULTISPECIES: NRAMP family divalent metal transporter [Shouchella]|jgi:Mn2+/Fe2+ NRAMP family transporter|uniref:NRAMP family divalent metal transporter n=1 Tax=Shouchella TaxID=2893057 RepID=UPI00090EC1D4|nr:MULTISPECIES: NRAMP family divalent metal transporter [Shouchella]MDO7266777.1 divalent metal cation transporter [Shouchella clausii]MDO7283984.1 divalent metal cation transporter [Shouchella clausii]MDO7286308.1 divalent metal cation transporter [Shouchella clausii]MDO7304080.1 divalent metal cation transporter [Shouchella clausii]SHL30800.1 Mn2+ and Fe2+ transporters of the NRAMP family [Shouchella rhizosphaerae]